MHGHIYTLTLFFFFFRLMNIVNPRIHLRVQKQTASSGKDHLLLEHFQEIVVPVSPADNRR